MDWFVTIVGGATGGLALFLVGTAALWWRLMAVEGRVGAIENLLRGQRGLRAQEEVGTEAEAALVDLAKIFQNKDMDDNAKMNAGLAVIANKPKLALKLAAKAGLKF